MTPHPVGSRDETSEVAIADARFEHRREALGLGTAQPRVSWIDAPPVPGWQQGAYALGPMGRQVPSLSKTGRIESSHSVLLPWPFIPQASHARIAARVQVWGMDGRASAWSVLSPLEVGLLQASDWTARFVTPA